MDIKETFQKQGGMKLLKQYFKSGALLTAVNQLLVLGRSRTALEILRLSAQLRTKQRLEKRYGDRLWEFDKYYDKLLPHRRSDKVWFCWFQGLKNAPGLVQRCYRSLKDNLYDKEIILITAENMMEYVELPDFILEKWRAGIITHTHMTDLLRLELLIRHGGMWVDATVLCTGMSEEIPEYYFDSDLFLYQCLKPGRDGHSAYISSWLISAKTNNRILMAARYLCYAYWKEQKEMLDYFLLHDFMSIVLEYYAKDWMNIVPVDNAAPHILLLRLFDEYDERIWKAVKEQTPFHKLSYKLGEEKLKMKNTYYSKIIQGDLNRGG